MKKRRYVEKGALIPYGAIVKVIKFLPKLRALVEYEGVRYFTLTRKLRKIT